MSSELTPAMLKTLRSVCTHMAMEDLHNNGYVAGHAHKSADPIAKRHAHEIGIHLACAAIPLYTKVSPRAGDIPVWLRACRSYLVVEWNAGIELRIHIGSLGCVIEVCLLLRRGTVKRVHGIGLQSAMRALFEMSMPYNEGEKLAYYNIKFEEYEGRAAKMLQQIQKARGIVYN